MMFAPPAMDNSTLLTTFSTIPALLLKEIRIERGMQQSDVALTIGKTHSAWTKVESGQSQLTLEVFLKGCKALMVQSSEVMNVSEKYFQIGYAHGWRIIPDLNPSDDLLMRLAQNYYKNTGTRQLGNNWNFLPQVLQTPYTNFDGKVVLADVFLWGFNLNDKGYVGNQPPTLRLG